MANIQRGWQFLSWGAVDLQGRGEWLLQNKSQDQLGFHKRLLFKAWGAPKEVYGTPEGHLRDLAQRAGLHERVGVATGTLIFTYAASSGGVPVRLGPESELELSPHEAGVWRLPEQSSGEPTDPHTTGYTLLYPEPPAGGGPKEFEIQWVAQEAQLDRLKQRMAGPESGDFHWQQTLVVVFRGALTIHYQSRGREDSRLLRPGNYARLQRFEYQPDQANEQPAGCHSYERHADLLATVLFF